MKVKCANCKEYIEKSSAIPRGISNFCSMDCVFAKANKGKSGSGFASKAKSKPNKGHKQLVSPIVRDAVLKRDNYSCRLCGKANNLAVHHIIYKSDKKNKPWENEVSNLITLCNHPCHLSIVHGNKKRFQPICLMYIWFREVEGKLYSFDELEIMIKEMEKNHD